MLLCRLPCCQRAFAAPATHLQHRTCPVASEGLCASCTCAPNGHAHAAAAAARSRCNAAQGSPCDHMQAGSLLQLLARCSLLQPCQHMHVVPPASARSGVARCSATHCIIGRSSTQCQALGAVGRCIGLAAGASCSIRKHPACSHRPPRRAPSTCTPQPHMMQLLACSASCESEIGSRRSDAIGMRCSSAAAALPHPGSPHAAADARCSPQPCANTCTPCPLWSTARGHARAHASMHCIARRRPRHR